MFRLEPGDLGFAFRAFSATSADRSLRQPRLLVMALQPCGIASHEDGRPKENPGL
jgi:hypothetical protein